MTSVLDAIGNTPLVRLDRCAPANGAELWLKLEYRNPSGSMKDRMALAMIEGAERDGLLSAGDTVVEYTGGSTGPALALVCGAKGYRTLIVMADCYTEERFQLLRALGAEVDVVPSVEGRPRVTPQDIANMVERAAELAARPGHYATDQFNNPYIVRDHRDRLGREIWEQTGGRVTAFCQGLGTASSLMGVSEALKPHGVFIQGHEPAGSAAIGGGAPGSFVVQGRAGFVMPLWNADAVDHIEAIPDDEALDMTRRLARRARGGPRGPSLARTRAHARVPPPPRAPSVWRGLARGVVDRAAVPSRARARTRDIEGYPPPLVRRRNGPGAGRPGAPCGDTSFDFRGISCVTGWLRRRCSPEGM